MVDLVRGAGCQDHNTLEDGDDQLSIQTCLEESVQLRLLHYLFELIELDLFGQSARHSHPQIVELDS